MRKAWQIFSRDLMRLLRNPVAVAVTIGVAIIPSLYAWFNILANWDPYENTSTVPIAVTIEDKGADIKDLGYTNAGDMIRERLEENDQLGWTFVDDENEAVEGVKAGKYYAAFVVPSDFTQDLADVLDGNTDKAHIAYYVNEKANAVAPKVTDTGSTTIDGQISNQFVEVVGKTVAEKLQGVNNVTWMEETSACTILERVQSGLPHGGYQDELVLVYKAGSQPGEGTVVTLPGVKTTAVRQEAPASIQCKGTTLTYTYRFDKAVQDVHQAGTYTFTADLTTGNVSSTVPN